MSSRGSVSQNPPLFHTAPALSQSLYAFNGPKNLGFWKPRGAPGGYRKSRIEMIQSELDV